MGAELSIPLECTNFDSVEVKRLAKRFKKLDIDNSGSISPEEFMQLPELRSNPIVPRVINIFDKGKYATRVTNYASQRNEHV